MKNKLINISRAAALAMCAFAATQAQALEFSNVAVNVPFDFVVSGKTMPAGEYIVLRTNNQGATPTFVFRNMRTNTASIAVMSQRTRDTSDKAEVVFNCVENKCYLREMKVTGLESFVAPTPRIVSQKERITAIPLRTVVNAD